MKRFALCLLLAFTSIAQTESISALGLAGVTYISLSDIALHLGYSISETPDSLTLRADKGILLLFDNSPNALFKPTVDNEEFERSDVNLSAPVVKQSGQWYAPPDALEFLGIGFADSQLTLPDGRVLKLALLEQNIATGTEAYATVDLGNRVSGLAIYASGSAGPDSVSLLLVDLGLLALALPEQQQEVDAFVRDMDDGRPLYLAVTAVTESPWETTLVFSQNGQNFTARYPLNLSLLTGEAGKVSPASPVVGVILLPDWFNLRQPLSVDWAGVKASFQFRR